MDFLERGWAGEIASPAVGALISGAVVAVTALEKWRLSEHKA
jgi:hypothetical protein